MKAQKFVVWVAGAGLALALVACGASASSEDSTSAQGSGAAQTELDETEAEDEAEAQALAEAQAKAEDEAAQKAAEEAAALEEERAGLRSAAESEGLSVFVGTVKVMSGAELCDFEEVDPRAVQGNPEGTDESTYVLLLFDESTHVVGEGADGSPREGDAEHMAIGRSVPAYDFIDDTASAWLALDGQRVCVAGRPWFQTDVSLPFAPRMYDAKLLYQE